MNEDCLKLTTYFGERDRVDGGFLADALMACYGRRRFRTSLIVRGIEGFGAKQRLRTDRLLTLSEDLPMISVAVDARERIEAAVPEVVQYSGDGLITLERARMPDDDFAAVRLPEELHEATKLTVYVGRGERVGARPAYVAIVDLLRRHGVAGATVLLGVDGTVHGTRQRAAFFADNANVPLMVISVGEGARIANALSELGELPRRPIVTLERIRVCKRDGARLAEPRHLPAGDPSGLALWQKMMVYCSERSEHAGKPLYHQLIARLREAGASGATCVRGIWGYHGDHRPHGDAIWQLRRRVPVLTVIVDAPERIRRWFQIVDELTDETGLVTSEIVPGLRAAAPDAIRGGLRLADPRRSRPPAGPAADGAVALPR